MADDDEDICRVCRSNGSPDKPLFHPCICTGSIRHVHQDCLVQWLKHSRKEYCELCKHKFTFKPIYSPDMPNRLPLRDLFFGLARSIGSAVKCWIHYTLVAIAWLGIVPLTASRIYNCVFAGSVSVLISLPKDMLSTRNIGHDILHGCVVVTCTLIAFISLIWLRVQILNGDMPAWLMPWPDQQPQVDVQQNEANDPNLAGDNENVQVQDENDVDDNNNDQAQNQAEEEVPIVEEMNDAHGQENNEADNVNWNAIDWERPGNEPTWERILGLDGSLMFLEHVFWVVALNTLFIVVFAFCPYHLGHFFLIVMDLNSCVLATKFEGVLTSLCGYILIAFTFLLCHLVVQIAKFRWPGRIFGLCYIILKVGLLVLVEIGGFPLVCGVWLDICTLRIFNCTLQSRQLGYLTAPGTSIFFHWLVGMVFVFYFATFLMILREVLRPGTLWFFRNLNDPNFNPINEMIHLPVYRHCRRFLLSVIMFGSTIIVIAWLPVQFVIFFFPDFLPYHGAQQHSSPIGEIPLQLMVLQFILPCLLEQGHTKVWIKNVIRWWSHVIGSLLGVRSYLLGDEHVVRQVQEQNNNIGNQGNAERDQLQVPPLHPLPDVDHEWNVHQPYTKPSYFALRLVILLCCMATTFALVSCATILVPVSIGRHMFQIVIRANATSFISGKPPAVVHELYTFAFGLYFCWVSIYLGSLLYRWIPRGWHIIKAKIYDGLVFAIKASILSIFVAGLFPLLLGIIFDLVIVIPVRVPLHHTPVLFLWQDWALGIILLKLTVGIVLMGPNSWLKTDIEEAYQQGLRRLDLKKLILNTLVPVTSGLLTCLAVPYFIGHLIPIISQCDISTVYILHWRTYPILIIATFFGLFCVFEIKQFYHLYDRIKNERYLIGKRLIDYDPPRA